MASAVKGPLGRFRKHDSPSPLHERWGDVRITVPTEGSWNQYENPRQSSLRKGSCSTGFVPSAMSRGHDDETAPLTEYDHRTARPSSLSIKALNPRRLSVRLNPRSKTSIDYPQEKDQQPTTKAERRRSQFAYRPIQQDYPTEIAEKTAFPEPRSPRFKYIPAGAQFAEELRAISPELHSSRRASSYIPYDEGSLERRARARTRFDQLEDAFGDQVFEGGHHHSRQSRSLASPRRSEASGSRRASASVERGLRLSTFDKRATRLGRYMTTAMVPEPDQLYE
ncbi:hypothetical protein ASPACDRAFT_1852823 [Aspergillus aculeatus ATCC 16872]|uniref:Uncharacterized protein n=1 Tax=Aspergillus aculeatus (strain ATCC 16872 / CBS 172.66 / WB 5094) TaxID=690307 RepID=A0A1L9X649_ASPA1|nr:uncharacterized protein ASPACDRAFT_1852823 [Aspergillus aculeatus ATCC 16872]OJK03902.1 hypothetical protein ASPACDRAFT_1852823 [Aspergillus aculeatus ATCC 16872]